MFHFFSFVVIYMLYGVFLSALMYKYNIWQVRQEFKDNLKSQLFFIILLSPFFTIGLIFIESPIRLFKYIIENDPSITDDVNSVDNVKNDIRNISNNDNL